MKNILFLGILFISIFGFKASSTESKTVFYQSVEWSHDGKSICFAAIILDSGKYVNGRWEIYTMKIDGSDFKKITENNFNDMWPSFSPDDKSIFFQSDRNGNQEIYSMDIDGSNVKRITDNSGSDNYPVCSPDGKKILFTSNRDGNQDIYSMNINGTEPFRLTRTKHKEFNPCWSPDGKKIVYFYEKGDHKDQIYICNSDGSNSLNITNDTLNNIYPEFYMDGTAIIYGTSNQKEKYLCTVNASGQNKITLSKTAGFFNRCWHDNKQKLSIKGSWPSSEIYLSTIEGAEERTIANVEKILILDSK